MRDSPLILTAPPPSQPDHRESPKTLSVPEAGRLYFDLGEAASYQAAHRGDIPVIRIGRRLRVPVCALERMLEDASDKAGGQRAA